MIAMENGTRHEVKTNLIFLGIGFSKRFNWAYVCFAGRPRQQSIWLHRSTRVEQARAAHTHVVTLSHRTAKKLDHLGLSFAFESY